MCGPYFTTRVACVPPIRSLNNKLINYYGRNKSYNDRNPKYAWDDTYHPHAALCFLAFRFAPLPPATKVAAPLCPPLLK